MKSQDSHYERGTEGEQVSWSILVLWECEISNEEAASETIAAFLDEDNVSSRI
jgi:G:T-mismatch repair DNA endonuclease (very short patch repair protein)